MGWCHEFGPQIQEGCSHPMVAGSTSCGCAMCGAVCRGRFNGCNAVWERSVLASPPARTFAPMPIERPAPVAVPVAVAPEPAFEPPRPVPPPPPPVAAPPPPPRRPRPGLSMAAHRDGLDALKSRLSGLRGELADLGDAVRSRSGEGG